MHQGLDPDAVTDSQNENSAGELSVVVNISYPTRMKMIPI